MAWSSAIKEKERKTSFIRPKINKHKVDFERLVTLDWETYYDTDYTLRKLSTSEYIRDERFIPHMVGIKIGKKKTKVIKGSSARAALKSIPWATHSLLCHNTLFDGFILSHHYGIVPKFYYDTLSMARALHRQDISASLNEVAQYYGVGNKLPDVLDKAKGVKDLKKEKLLYDMMAEYCKTDVDLTFDIFKLMLEEFPHEEIRLIDQTVRMFCDPVLQVDIPRVEKELAREIQEKEDLILNTFGTKTQLTKELLLHGREQTIETARKRIASNESFAAKLRKLGVKPPVKISPAWIKKAEEDRNDDNKWAYAFSKTDLEFIELLEHRNPEVRNLVAARFAVKSTLNETRAERFLKAGADGAKLPVGYTYAAAHTLRWGGANKMNMQNLRRGSELRKSIIAPKGHKIVVVDSGQIEPRVNAWLWGQEDLLEDFRRQDSGKDRDVYCKFGDIVYGREINKTTDILERFVSKVCVLGLGYGMAGPKLQNTLALGTMGPPVFIKASESNRLVSVYRRKQHKIVAGWQICNRIIEDMSTGREGSWKGVLNWEKNRVWLPNGMALKYPNLRRIKDEQFGTAWVYDRKGSPVKIYGSLLCENFVQALSRIIVAFQLLDIVDKGITVAMMTHDEIVSVVKTSLASISLNTSIAMMTRPLDWCPDLPLAAEGGFDDNYSK